MQFEFISDRPVLDFVSTVAERGTTNEEKLRKPADLAAWIRESRLVDAEPAVVTPRQLEQATMLREATFRLVTTLIDGSPIQAADRALVNSAAAKGRPVLQLTTSGQLRRTGDLDTVLAVLANDCLDLFDSADRYALQWCDDATCTRPYIDRSRGHRRRWCGMKGCGDRAKAAAYRERHRVNAGD